MSKIRRSYRNSIGVFLLAVCLTAGGAVPAANEEISYEEAYRLVTEFIDNNPNDYVGLEALINEIDPTSDELEVVVSGVDGLLNAEDATTIIAEREATLEEAIIARQNDSTVDSNDLQLLSVPSDAFTVSFAFIGFGGTTFPAAVGQWNFRDDYVNGSDPKDIASIRLDLGSCVYINETTASTATWDGRSTTHETWTLYDAGLGTQAPIIELNDRASNFELNVDNGFMITTLGYGCDPGTIRGMFTYEHNQDGGSVSSVSASFGAFSISYTGNPSTLQLSTQIATASP